jgi:glycosyltransferase involved in cell wall biosynthesis
VGWEEGIFSLLSEIARVIDDAAIGIPDIIHAQCQVSFLLGAVLKEHLGCRLVVTPHETQPERDGLGAARSRFLFNLPQIDLLIAGSETFARQAIEYGRSELTTAVVESSIRPWISAPPRKARVPGQRSRILSIGRFKPRKNQLVLLDAIAQLRAEGRAVSCTFVGACDAASVAYRDELDAGCRKTGGYAVLVESASDAELQRLIEAADLVVQPALAEGLGLAAIEALAAGKTVLATPTSGAVEVLGEFPMLLTRGWEVSHLAGAISDALDRPGQYAIAAAQAAEAVRARFGSRANAVRMLTLYRDLVGEKA